MALPNGVMTKMLTFGRYVTALGNPRGGTIAVGFDEPILHVPTGEVITGTIEVLTVNAATGVMQIPVPVTVTPDLVTKWRDASPYTNQRLRIDLKIDGYKTQTFYVDIHPEDPPEIDFDTMGRYPTSGGLPVERAAVSSVAGLTGDVGAEALANELSPFIGGGGGGTGEGFTYTQSTPSASWPISHGYARYPRSVTVWVDGAEVFADVETPDTSTISIVHATPVAGRAEILF